MTGYAYAIGDLARETGSKVQTIRYYEEIGLLPPAVRTAGNQRRYKDEHVARLAFIRHGRELGFSLDAIRDLLSLSDHPDRPCDQAHELAKAHLTDVERRIASLQALHGELQALVSRCERSGRAGDCRVIEVLADHSHAHCVGDHHDETA
jgi:DNA-binding transcriptional MerR regulator